MGNRRGFDQKKENLGASAAHVTKTFTAPTSGLEDVYFTWDTVINIARYTKVIDKLKEYVVVHFQDQAMGVVKAIEELKSPVFTKKERPVRMYWSVTSREPMALNMTKLKRNPETGSDNKPVLKDLEHKLEVDEYTEGYNTHKEGTKEWEENRGKCYYLVLQHCTPELKTELKNLARWEATVSDTDVVSLLLIVRDVMHNTQERKQSTMVLVESDAAFYTAIMKGSNTLNRYYRVFKAHIDTIEAHDGNPGYHSALVQEHMEANMVDKRFDTPTKQKNLKGNDLKMTKTEALKSSKGAYLGYLFLMMADDRYEPVNMFLHEGFLADRHQYPRDVLATKIFMANFIGTATAQLKRQ